MAESHLDVSNRALQYCLAQYQNALDVPLNYRCILLSQLFANSSLKELKLLFSKLVEDVFGFRNRNDWGLISSLQSSDFHALRSFLAPDGPLLQLAYKLLNNHHPTRFEFPVACLPPPSRHLMESGDVPAFYSSKVQKFSDRVLSSNLQLNSFEYYFFHFACYIVRSPEKYAHDTVGQNKALYSHLLEDYLMYFLPAEGIPVPLSNESSTPPSPPSPFRSTTWPTPPNTNYPLTSTPSSYIQSPTRPRHSLLKPGIALTLNDSSTANVADSSGGSMKTEDWRSEEFVGILSEMYINQMSLEYPHSSTLMESYVPNQYHVWMVRLLVKHSHYFSNSLLTANHLLGSSPLVIDPMRQLKSCIFPRYIQKDMHIFLKMIFDRWPLDASFQVPLEMWLSYIQPWRYIHPRMVVDPGQFEHKWHKFISDNFSFYTPVLIKVLCRFSRMDLSCPRNAFMLFRVSKVFAQENMYPMIHSIEHNFQAANTTANRHWSYTSCPSPFTANRNMTSFPQESSEVDTFVPLFSEIVVSQVTHLLREIALAYEKLNLQTTSKESSSEGFFSQLLNFLTSEGSISGYWSSDSKKLKAHLEESMKNLCKLFKLPPPVLQKASPSQRATTQQNLLKSCFYESENHQKLPIMKNLWALSKKAKPDILARGHPDFQPIKTYEYHFLVKILAEVSAQLNAKYAQNIQSWYYKSSVLGRMWQQLLAPPTTYYKTIKSKDMMSVQHKPIQLPPRIRLRYFADKRRVICFIIYVAVMFYLDFHPFPAITFLLLLFLLKVFVKALFHLHKTVRTSAIMPD